jgi:Arc/MetJ-type ribon-helix-helix transcriptional regulator
MKNAQKVTVEVPRDLLARAQKMTGRGPTDTIRQGLQLVAASRAYERFRKRRGQIRLAIDLARLREDRD